MLRSYSPAHLFVPPLRGSNPQGWKHARENRSGEDLHCMTRAVPGEERLTWGAVLVSPVLPVARHPGLFALVTFCTWPGVLGLLLYV